MKKIIAVKPRKKQELLEALKYQNPPITKSNSILKDYERYDLGVNGVQLDNTLKVLSQFCFFAERSKSSLPIKFQNTDIEYHITDYFPRCFLPDGSQIRTLLEMNVNSHFYINFLWTTEHGGGDE